MRLTHIVVVEDADEDFDTLQDAARLSGVLQPIVRARTGADGLRLLRAMRDAAGGRVALPLLLLDLNLPGDDGRDVLRAVRSDVTLAAWPVVVLSASANLRDLTFCYAHGANAYHVKPVDHVRHLQVLRSIFCYWLDSVELPA